MTDDREPLGRLAYETEAAWRSEQLLVPRKPWNDLIDSQREPYIRIGSAVAFRAVADAKLEDERMKAQLFAVGTALPAARRALVIAIAEAAYEAEAKPFRRALEIFGGEEGPADPQFLAALGESGAAGQERSEKKDAGHG